MVATKQECHCGRLTVYGAFASAQFCRHCHTLTHFIGQGSSREVEDPRNGLKVGPTGDPNDGKDISSGS